MGNKDVSDNLLSVLFVKLVGKIGSFKKGVFDSWLFKTASNIFHDYLRAKYREKKLLENQKEQLESRLTEPGQSETRQIDNLQIQLNKLDAETRELIMLRFYS